MLQIVDFAVGNFELGFVYYFYNVVLQIRKKIKIFLVLFISHIILQMQIEDNLILVKKKINFVMFPFEFYQLTVIINSLFVS